MVTLDDIWKAVKKITDLPNAIKDALLNSDKFSNFIANSVSKAIGIDNIKQIVRDIPKLVEMVPKILKTIEYDPLIFDDLVAQLDDEARLLTRTDFSEINNPKKEWYDHDWSPAETMDGRLVHYYETRKIRVLLQKITLNKGYPVAFAQDLVFSMFVGLRVPTGWTVHKLRTIDLWVNNKSARWRKVIINFRGTELTSMILQVLQTLPYVGTSLVFQQIGLAENSCIEYDIYDNLAYESALNDGVILANWDRVKARLEQYYKGKITPLPPLTKKEWAAETQLKCDTGTTGACIDCLQLNECYQHYLEGFK